MSFFNGASDRKLIWKMTENMWKKTVRDYRRQKYFHVKWEIILLMLLNSPLSKYPKLQHYHLFSFSFNVFLPPSISPLFSSYSPACLAVLAAVWPKSPATGTTLEGAESSISRLPPPRCVCLCARLCFFLFALVYVNACGRPHACMRACSSASGPCQHDLDLTGW